MSSYRTVGGAVLTAVLLVPVAYAEGGPPLVSPETPSPAMVSAPLTPEGRPCVPEPTVDTMAYGDLVSCAIDVVGDSDTFRFTGAAGDVVVVQVARTGSGNPRVELFDTDGTRVGTGGGWNATSARIDVVLTKAGTHTILVSEWENGETLSYNVVLERVRPTSPIARVILPGQNLDDAIDPIGDLDWFVFAARAGDAVVVQVARTGSGNPRVELFDSDGVRVGTGGGWNATSARIDVVLTKAGTHTVLVSEWENGETLPYRIDLQCIGACPPLRTALTLTRAGTGTGTVTSSPAGIDCGTTCSAFFPLDASVTLTAVAQAGATFLGFSGDADCTDGTVTMNVNVNCTATFQAQSVLTVTKAGTGSGTVTSSPAGINCGMVCSAGYAAGAPVALTAVADAGSTFLGFGGNADCADGTVAMNGNISCTATFQADSVLTITKAGTGSGTVTSNPAGIDCGTMCSARYAAGAPVALTAVAEAGSTFLGFGGNGDCIDGAVTMTTDVNCTATFNSTSIGLSYYLAEGATGPFFDLELALANPYLVTVPVAIQYLRDDGSTASQSLTLAPQSRQTILVDALPGLDNIALSTVVTSSNGLPLAVERTMTWDQTGYGSHTEKATAGANVTWYFAEGSEQAFFDTYLLLANPQPTANRATVVFLVEGGDPVTKVYDLLPTSRTNIYAQDVEAPGGAKVLLNKAFGMVVSFDQPGVAERAMYFGTLPFWNGGHESAGVTAPSTRWFHAEGATGTFFDTYILLSNPNATPATVTLRFLLDSGATVTRVKAVPANARVTVNVEAEDPLLASAALATEVTSDLPIVSERAMYWAQYPDWYEAHNAFGVTSTGLRWALGEGRIGGASGYETYVLLANPGTTAATVKVTFLREGGRAPIVETYIVQPTSRFNVYANHVPGLADGERFGALIESTAPIAVERAMYSNATSQPGLVWSAGTCATATPIP